MAEFHNPSSLWKPFGAFSMVAVQTGGRIVRLKGQVSLDPAGEVVGPGDMNAQVRQTLTNIETALASMGGRLSDVIELTHYTTDIQGFMAAGDVRMSFFAPPYPVTTTVEVAALYHPDLVIEITALAEIPSDRFHAPAEG